MSTVQRTDMRDQWDAFCLSHPDGWFFHTNAWIDYALAYSPGAMDESVGDVAGDGTVMAIQPRVVVDGFLAYGVGKPGTPVCVYGGRRPAERLVRHVRAPSLFPSRVLNLTTWTLADVRKSYRSLIRQQCEDFNYLVLDENSLDEMRTACMGVARLIHRQNAGRETRPAETWRMMEDWIAHGSACLTVAFDGWRMVGYAYCLLYKTWAYYASSATLSECGHGLQFKTIQYLIKTGWSAYQIGDEEPTSSKKGQDIQFFKAGFGGEVFRIHGYEQHRAESRTTS